MVFFYPGLMENHIVSGTYFTKGMREKDKFTTLLGETIQVDSIKGMYPMSVSLSVRLLSVCSFIILFKVNLCLCQIQGRRNSNWGSKELKFI